MINENRRCLSSILSAFLTWTQWLLSEQLPALSSMFQMFSTLLGWIYPPLSVALQSLSISVFWGRFLFYFYSFFIATCYIHITCLFGTFIHLSQLRYIRFSALAETSLYGKCLGLWSWLIQGDSLTFKAEAAPLLGSFFCLFFFKPDYRWHRSHTGVGLSVGTGDLFSANFDIRAWGIPADTVIPLCEEEAS